MKTKRAKQTAVDHDKPEEQKHEKKIDDTVRKEGKKRKKMKKVGIDFDFPAYASLVFFFYLTLKAVYQLSSQKVPLLLTSPPLSSFFQDAEVKAKRAKQTRVDHDKLEET